MKDMTNKEYITGRVYEHNLQIKVGQVQGKATYGKEYITGELKIAVDEEGLNVISVRYPCVMPFFAGGKTNSSYPVLKKIIEENSTWLDKGKEAAPMVFAQPSIALRDFYDDQKQLVSYKVNEGGFISFWKGEVKEDRVASFLVDMVITNKVMVDPDPEGESEEPEYMKLKGAVFNYKKELLPTDFVIKSEEGIGYFDEIDVSPSDPVIIKLKGEIISKTIKEEVTQELAFGTPITYTKDRQVKEWRVTGAFPIVSELEEGILTKEELTKAMQDREIRLAEEKARSEAWKAQRAAGVSQAPPNMGINDIPKGDFNFNGY